jgi:hypothetical protein
MPLKWNQLCRNNDSSCQTSHSSENEAPRRRLREKAPPLERLARGTANASARRLPIDREQFGPDRVQILAETLHFAVMAI